MNRAYTDLDATHCVNPATARPPACRPEADGTLQVATTSSFRPCFGADPGGHSPPELYLMGLVPQTEAGSPCLVLEHLVGDAFPSRVMGRYAYTYRGSHQVTIDPIIGQHGARSPASASEHSFRPAFVTFSTTPVSAAPERA